MNSTVKFLSSQNSITVQSLEKLDNTVQNLYPTNFLTVEVGKCPIVQSTIYIQQIKNNKRKEQIYEQIQRILKTKRAKIIESN